MLGSMESQHSMKYLLNIITCSNGVLEQDVLKGVYSINPVTVIVNISTAISHINTQLQFYYCNKHPLVHDRL